MVRTPEGYGLYDSTLRQPFNGAYILVCADRVLKEKEEKDFKSRFARKAKSDLRAYLDLKAKREAELEELYTRPYEDIAVEEFRASQSAGGGNPRAREGHSDGRLRSHCRGSTLATERDG